MANDSFRFNMIFNWYYNPKHMPVEKYFTHDWQAQTQNIFWSFEVKTKRHTKFANVENISICGIIEGIYLDILHERMKELIRCERVLYFSIYLYVITTIISYTTLWVIRHFINPFVNKCCLVLFLNFIQVLLRYTRNYKSDRIEWGIRIEHVKSVVKNFSLQPKWTIYNM